VDITKTVEPRSDQLNYDDVMAQTLTVTITDVKAGPPDQPVHLHLEEFPKRPYKPGKSMRRVLIAAWGVDASEYVGRRLTLYGDPTVKFGGQEVGGIRISHLSHITAPLEVHLTVTRGKRTPFVVQPLEAPVVDAEALADALRDAVTLEELKAAWGAVQRAGLSKNEALIGLKDDRKAELDAALVETGEGDRG
jgi:hypothetical protein